MSRRCSIMGWKCECGHDNEEDTDKCGACDKLRRAGRTEEDLERLLDEDLRASRKITIRL